jgi:alkylated DNA repair dioxygenase AlkB
MHRKFRAASGFALPDLAQVLVTDYAPSAPIGWHKDSLPADR